jgi:HSP20 family protein
MFYRTVFPRDLLAQLEHLQRELQQPLNSSSPSIRGFGSGSFPAINVGHTPQSVDLYAFVPGVDPSTIEVQLEKGVLTIGGERPTNSPPKDSKATVHIDERFTGRFRRVITLPDDIDPETVTARCRDGVVHFSIKRRSAAQPRRINIQ